MLPSLSQSSPLYNGNISETRWKTRTDNRTKSYRCSYDSMNRLTDAVYSGYILQNVSATQNENCREKVSYDKNGNIGTMLRYGLKVNATNPANNTIGIIDHLTYYYEPNSNRLKKVIDTSARPEGFDNGTTESDDDYDYDGNGNMTADLNKGIGKVQAYKTQYNHLNLPTTVQISSTKKINYTYDATGAKLQKKVTEGSTITTTQYDNGFIYEKGSGANELKFFNHAEGYVKAPLPSGGSYNPDNFEYIYQYKDHLGNVRVSYREASSGNLEIIEENHYYAFGLQHKGYNNNVLTTGSSQAQRYKYQGQERQDELNLNWDSFKWRNYDYAIGRFFNIDPLAEDFYYNSPYAFSENKVISHFELEGLEAVLAITMGDDVKYRGGMMSKAYPGTIHTNIRSGGIAEFVQALKTATASDPKGIGFVAVWGHGIPQKLFSKGGDVNIWREDFQQINDAIKNGEIKFAPGALIYLGNCNSASQALAQALSGDTGAEVIGANDVVGPIIENLENMIYTVGFPNSGTSFKSFKDGEFSSSKGPKVDVLGLLRGSQMKPSECISCKNQSMPRLRISPTARPKMPARHNPADPKYIDRNAGEVEIDTDELKDIMQ